MYIINGTMQEELDFIRQALQEDLGIDFETPIAFIIPRISTALLFGDSLLQSFGGYSFELKIWWYVQFPQEIVLRTLLHLKNNKDSTFISINCLEYITIVINYCAALTAFYEDFPNPVVLCVTDNISATNWTIHMSKNQLSEEPLQDFSAVSLLIKELASMQNGLACSKIKSLMTYQGSRLLTYQILLLIMTSHN